MIFIMWVLQNIPGLIDLQWLAKGGGIVGNRHPHARKFNAGQKIVFWLVVLGTISVSLSGLALMFPFQTGFMAKTFVFLNIFGLDLPTSLSPVAEQQLNQVWHATVGIGFICVILGHIYIGTVGMEGALSAMTTGEVDANWAREHHSLWVEEVEAEEGKRSATDGKLQPAE
jgi:formate dehydrogenase subunit gamma